MMCGDTELPYIILDKSRAHFRVKRIGKRIARK